MILRDYQSNAIGSLRTSLATGHQRPVLCLPTGGGKTVIAGSIVKSAFEKHKRVLFLAPRRELIYQASAAFQKFGIRHGVIMAGEPVNCMQSVQVASFDTLNARAMRRAKMNLPAADLVVVDEAHLSIAPSRMKLLSAYPDAAVIGLTATPARGDGKGLGEFYDDLVEAASMAELVKGGHLVSARYYAPSKPDLAGLKIARGDYVTSGLEQRMDRPELVGDILHNWQRLARDKQTVIFCCTRKHARHVHEEFTRAGYRSEYLDGETPTDERRQILNRMQRKESQVLVNVFVATFGLDIPSLECAVLARPTRSVVLYLQTVGRVLRTCEGKTEAIVIDHSGAVEDHGFVTDPQPWSLESDSTVRERRDEQKQNQPKEITCGDCGTVFKARRDCPNCGSQIVPASAPVPVHESDLQEVKPETLNRQASWDEKARFMGELKTYCAAHAINPGWAAHKYRAKFGVWPNDPRVKEARPTQAIRPETASWIRSQNIRWAKSKEKAA